MDLNYLALSDSYGEPASAQSWGRLATFLGESNTYENLTTSFVFVAVSGAGEGELLPIRASKHFGQYGCQRCRAVHFRGGAVGDAGAAAGHAAAHAGV